MFLQNGGIPFSMIQYQITSVNSHVQNCVDCYIICNCLTLTVRENS